MIEIGKVTMPGSGYTVLVEGNGGEEQFIFITTPALNKCPILIANASVEGGLDITTNRTAPSKHVHPYKVPEYFENALRAWTLIGDFSDVTHKTNEKHIQRAVKRLRRFIGIE